MRIELTSSLLILSFTTFIATSSNDPLDITDYTFYFQSYEYPLSFKPNDDIIIQLPNHALNFSNDADFNEIHIIPKTRLNHQRRLLWNKWDHTTSKHVNSGRFIGDPSSLRSFDDARALCREYYGGIASIQTQKENDQVKQLCHTMGAKECWIGLTANFYEWEDGQYVTWSDWASDQPEHSINEKCIKIEIDGKWTDSPCYREMYAICEKPIASYHGNYVVISKQTTKEKAAAYCNKQFGSTLASIITKTDAIQAHEACKMVAKAPHGCWIGLTAPFKEWDNKLRVEPIQGSGWKNGKIPEGKDMQCTEISRDASWKALPCDYERQILCNVHGVDTKQSEMDKEFMEKKEEEEKQEKIKEEEEREKKEEKQDTENKKEGEIDKGEAVDHEGVNPESPIEKQINELKKILKQQQQRLMTEKERFEGKQQESIHKMSEVDALKAEEHIHKPDETVDPNQGLKDEIARLQKIDTHSHGHIGGVHVPHNHMNGDRMGNIRRQARMMERMRMAHGNNGMYGGYSPFGGAFGGSLNNMPQNPYVPPPQPPMRYDEYRMMMGKMNPLRLPRIQGMKGLYAPSRRRLLEDEYKAMIKCLYDIKYKLCIEYDYESKLVWVDMMVCDAKVLKDLSDNREDIGYNVYKYEKMDWRFSFGNSSDKVVAYGEFDGLDDYIQYFIVYEFEFVFGDDMNGEKQEQCGLYTDGNRVCIEKYKDKSIIDLNGKVFNYNNDREWDEIYIEENRKCGNIGKEILCVIEDDINEYRLQVKVATEKLSKHTLKYSAS